MKTILVMNAKGGSGKTTIATNLAAYYALRGVKTALADFDDQASSLEWLEARDPSLPPIEGIKGWEDRVRPAAGTERLILDSPAHIKGREVSDLVRRADSIVVPVLPSPIDIRAAAHFIGDILTLGKIRAHEARIAVVANRVKEHTLVYEKLEAFLNSLKIPFVTHLRDSMNYIRAAERGMGVLELPLYLIERELEQWKPLVQWLERKK
jgi:chromosome partitioning protein